MTTPIDVFITAADEDADTAQKLASALTGAAITCAVDRGVSEIASTVSALESCRVLVCVLGPAANRAANVVRTLERASGRGVPIIAYEAAAAEPSPSIAYFTGTTAPIRGWGADDAARAIDSLLAACRQALQLAALPPPHTLSRPAFSRAEYRYPGPLLGTLTIILAACCGGMIYAIVQDGQTVAGAASLSAVVPRAVPVDPAGVQFLAPSLALWTIIIGSIFVFRRARLNLIARFEQHVTIGAGEIMWRPLVPVANVIWMPRMARQLRAAAAPNSGAADSRWRLATLWCGLFIATYLPLLVRDVMVRAGSGTPVAVAALGVAAQLTCLVLAVVTYAIWRGVAQAPRRKPAAVPAPVERTVAASPGAPADVLILHQPEDEPFARAMVAPLARLGCRCWTYTGEARDVPFTGFDAILVIVSQASHASERIVSLVQSATAARAHVVPVVVDLPPIGSALGHYVRSLQWLEAATLLVPGHEASLLSVFASTEGIVHTPPDDRVFAQLEPAVIAPRPYRSSTILRRAAWVAACVQITVAAALGLLAFGIAIDPEDAGDPSGNISILLAVFSLPAWVLFIAWLSRASNNAAALFIPGLGPRRRLLSMVGLPLASMVGGGAILSRWFAAILGRSALEVQQRAALFRRMWTIAGVVFTVCALLGWYLIAYHGLVRAAMVLTMCQAAATICRGAVRVKIISAVNEHVETRARVRTAPGRVATSISHAT